MRSLLFVCFLFSCAPSYAQNPPTHKRVKQNFSLDTEHLARVMVDLLITFEYIGCNTPAVVNLMHLIPDKAWRILDHNEVRDVMNRDELEYYHILWLRKKLAIHLESKFQMVEMAALIAQLENAGVADYLFDGII